MKTLTLTQNTPEWHAHRASARNASDVPAMLGISPYKSRAELLQEKATGIAPEVSPQQQRIFDRGHAIEALARPQAEIIIAGDLSPVIGQSDCGNFSASFDGLTFLEDVAWECKSLNDKLREALPYSDWNSNHGERLPEHYRAQMEQQAMVSGCQRVLFTAAALGDDGQLDDVRHCWYTPDPAMRQRIIDGWAQFDKDVATWQPTEATPVVQAAPVESLPAVVVQVQGALTVGGNLPAFGEALKSFIAQIPQKPASDQEFADAEAACKALKKAEDALTKAEESALAQVSDVEAMRRTVADLKALARQTRLATEKLVKLEKDARKQAIVLQARQDYETHLAKLASDLPTGIRLQDTPPDFGAAIKGLSSLVSMEEKLSAALIEGMGNANSLLSRVTENLQMLDSVRQYASLFPDRQELVHKDSEVLELLVHKRVTAHQQAEQERMEQERQRIEAEAQAKAEREAQAKLEAERARIAAEERAKAQAEAARIKAEEEAQAQAFDAANSHEVRMQHSTDIAAIAEKPPFETAASPAPASQVPFETADGETLTLGAINALLAPISINAAGLAELGFNPVAAVKAAKHYREADFKEICLAIIKRIGQIELLQKEYA